MSIDTLLKQQQELLNRLGDASAFPSDANSIARQPVAAMEARLAGLERRIKGLDETRQQQMKQFDSAISVLKEEREALARKITEDRKLWDSLRLRDPVVRDPQPDRPTPVRPRPAPASSAKASDIAPKGRKKS